MIASLTCKHGLPWDACFRCLLKAPDAPKVRVQAE